MITQTTIAQKTYTVCDFWGEAVDVSKQLETKVTGSGGGGSTWDGYGHTRPVEIHSTTTVHDDLYLLNANGQEKHFALTDWRISARIGHTMQVLWLIAENEQTGPYVAVYNKNLNQCFWKNDALQELANAHYRKQFWGSLLAVAVLAYVVGSFWLLFLGGIGTWIYWSKQKQVLVAEFKKAVTAQLI